MEAITGAKVRTLENGMVEVSFEHKGHSYIGVGNTPQEAVAMAAGSLVDLPQKKPFTQLAKEIVKKQNYPKEADQIHDIVLNEAYTDANGLKVCSLYKEVLRSNKKVVKKIASDVVDFALVRHLNPPMLPNGSCIYSSVIKSIVADLDCLLNIIDAELEIAHSDESTIITKAKLHSTLAADRFSKYMLEEEKEASINDGFNTLDLVEFILKGEDDSND